MVSEKMCLMNVTDEVSDESPSLKSAIGLLGRMDYLGY